MESEKKNRGKIKVIKRLLAVTGGIIGLVVVAFVILILILTVLEYKPEDRESLSAQGNSSKELLAGDTITVMSWNIGFGALGDNADFFIVNYEINGERKFFYKNDEILLNIEKK